MIDAENKIKGTRGGALCIGSLDPWKSLRVISDVEKRNYKNMHAVKYHQRGENSNEHASLNLDQVRNDGKSLFVEIDLVDHLKIVIIL